MENLHDGRYRADYDADNVRGPLLVVTKPTGGGKMLQGDDATHWAHHIRTALNKSEANTLCKSILDG